MQIKKIIVGVAAVGLLTAIAQGAIAAQPGAYVGGQLGYGNTHNEISSHKGDGLAGRIFAGYQFNNYLATELGWANYHTIHAKKDFYSLDRSVGWDTKLKTNVVDLTVKGIVPVAQDLNLYGKLGGAYVIQNLNVKGYGINRDGTGQTHVKGDATQKKLLPTATVGVSYDLTSNVSADVSYTHIQKIGNNSPDNIDFLGAGLTYNFG